MAKINKRWQFEIDFEEKWQSHPDIFQSSNVVEQKEPQPDFSVQEIIKETEPKLVANLVTEETIPLENIYDASMDIEIPFCFYETGMLNHNQTRYKYSDGDRAQFYINLIDNNPLYEPYQHLIDQIEIYLVFRWWDGNIDSLRNYVDIIQQIPNDCKETLIISFSGEIDFAAMRRQHDTKRLRVALDNILNKDAPFNSPMVQRLIDEFLKKHWISGGILEADENAVSFKTDMSYKANIFDFFYAFRFVLEWVGLRNMERNDLEKTFNQFFRCIKFMHEKWVYRSDIFTDYDDLDNAKNDFKERFEEKESKLFGGVLDVMRKIMKISCVAKELSYADIKKIYEHKFVVNMLASYMKKWSIPSSLIVYKRNAIVEEAEAPPKLPQTHRFPLPETNPSGNSKFSDLIKKIPELRSSDWWITHKPTETRVDKNKILAYPPDKWEEKLKQWVDNLVQTTTLIGDLEILLQNEWLSGEIEIFADEGYIFSNLTHRKMLMSDIFQEADHNFWKIIILQELRDEPDVTPWNGQPGDKDEDLDYPF